MAHFEARPKIEMKVSMLLTESEAHALVALGCYGTDKFIQFFYEHLGSSYLKEHEGGLRSLLDVARDHLPAMLKDAQTAREVFTGRMVAAPRAPWEQNK